MRSSSGRATPLTLLYLDNEVLAVNKPAGLLSVPGRGPDECVIDLLRQRPELHDNAALRVVHRLDQDASGVLLYARTLAAQRSLVSQFADRRIEKVYLAIVSGPVADDGEINLRLTFDRRHNRVQTTMFASGKPALTRYRVVRRLAGHTLLECHPVTGRQHQIRVHLAAIGHPLGVDPLYGGGRAIWLSHYKADYRGSERRPERPLIERLTLHAARITFEHPTTGLRAVVEAPLPKDFRATITQLGRWA
jgi:23S rRNA pseudouridine1911/1915/1917 synthase